MADVRRKNTATPLQVQKIIRANIKALSEPDYLAADSEKICEVYEDFLADVLRVTLRPSEVMLRQATGEVFSNSPEQIKCFCQRIIAAAQFVCSKSVSRTSGAKLSPFVNRLCDIVEETKRSQSPGVKELRPTSSSSQKSCSSQKVQESSLETSPLHRTTSSSFRKKSLGNSPIKVGGFASRVRRQLSLQGELSSDTRGMSPSKMSRDQLFRWVGIAAPATVVSSDDEAAVCTPVKERSDSASQSVVATSAVKQVAEYVDRAQCTVVRQMTDGSLIVAEMRPNPSTGFATAFFPDGSKVASEIPNLALELHRMPPVAKKKVCKKPAGHAPAKKKKKKKKAAKDSDFEAAPTESTQVEDSPTVEDLEEEDVPTVYMPPATTSGGPKKNRDKQESPSKMLYGKMWYEKPRCIGIREKLLNKKQVFSFRTKTLSEEVMRTIGDDLLAKLNNGSLLVAEGCNWAKEKMAEKEAELGRSGPKKMRKS